MAQLTIALADEINPTQGLVTYNVLVGENNPELDLRTDCKVTTSEYKLLKGVYTYQLGHKDH